MNLGPFEKKEAGSASSSHSRARLLAALSLAFAICFASVPLLFADESPPLCSKADGGQGNTSTSGINFSTHQAHLGDIVQVFPVLGMVPMACEAQHATGAVYIASGLLVTFLNDVTLDPGFIYQCPTNTSPPCTAGPYQVTISPALVGAGVNSPGGSVAGVPHVVRALQWAFSSQVRTGNPEETLDKVDTASIRIVTPCIQVQKFCDLPVGKACFGANDPIRFRGVVTNCGDITLTNVTALDSRIGPLVLLDPATGTPLNPGNPSGPVTLAPGAFAIFTNSYIPTQQEICAGNATNVVTVRGTDTSDIGGPNASVTNAAIAICPICINPCVAVTKNCNPPIVQAGMPVTFSGIVTNCGDITLTNVILTDTFLGLLAVIPVLPPGAAHTYSTNYLTTMADCGRTLTNTVVAVGQDNCNTHNVTNSASCAFLVECAPCLLSVTKTACVTTNPVVAECTGGAIAITLQYTGPSINAPTTVTIKGSGTTPVVYSLPSLNNGDILTMSSQNGFTIDATALGSSKLGATTYVYINSSYEVLHTSCSCSAYPTNNLMVCHPECLDASSPDNTAGVKGPGSPLWTLMALKDPTLGVVTCPSLTTTNSGPLTNLCSNLLPPLQTNSACSGKIHELQLGYIGGGCAAMQNSQAAGKVICTNSLSASSASPVRIRITDPPGGHLFLDTGVPASVNLGDVVDAVAGAKADAYFPADLVITIYDAANVLIESVRLKADCSQPVKLGDIYGGLEVVQLTSQKAGTVALGAQVDYTYVIQNHGGVALTNVTVVDDLLGPISGSPIPVLGAGETVTLTQSALISSPTTNTVTVVGYQGAIQCVATASAAVVRAPTPCPCVLGYPFASDNPRTSVVFNESEILAGFSPTFAGPSDTLKVWYTDEHALTLGVRRVIVKTSNGTSTNDYPVTPLASVPGSALNPQVGTMALTGDQAGTDPLERPIWPSLFITDITADPNSRSNDWQYGGIPIPPHAIFGTWKGAIRTVNQTVNPPTVTVTPDADPAKNGSDLGSGDAPPPGTLNLGFMAEARWNISDLIAAGIMHTGRVYRVQFMVHDGDQNKVGGDVGENCAIVGLGVQPECPPTPPATNRECSSGIVGFLVEYTGPSMAAGTTITFKGSSSAMVVANYNFPNGLTNGTVLSLPFESDPGRPWTIDATKHGATKLGTTTSVYFNSVLTEVLHTSCSCRMNNFIPGQPACLDASSPDNPTGIKGEPSPLFLVLDFK